MIELNDKLINNLLKEQMETYVEKEIRAFMMDPPEKTDHQSIRSFSNNIVVGILRYVNAYESLDELMQDMRTHISDKRKEVNDNGNDKI